MVTEAQMRILRRLDAFPDSMRAAWDVPRDLSQPGLSDHLGVVRSALHAPLVALQEGGLVEARMAHVIGGGSRRRNVYHISDEGRTLVASSGRPEVRSSGAILFGDAPEPIDLRGRGNDLKAVKDMLTGGSARLTGMSGIGKTVLARTIASEMVQEGRSVHWVTATRFTDAPRLVSGWFGHEPLVDASARLDLIGRDSTALLVVDDAHLISNRHLESVRSLIQAMMDGGETLPDLLLVGRAPMAFGMVESEFRLGPLNLEASIGFLDHGLELEHRRRVAEALGGHPSALLMHDPTHEIPEASDGIQSFVSNVILAGLEPHVLSTVDELCLEPLPVPADELRGIETLHGLDDHAMLRWSSKEPGHVELQRLIRNVRREALPEATRYAAHGAAAEHWSTKEGDLARLLEIHHSIRAGRSDLRERISEGLLAREGAAMAVLLDDGLERQPQAHALREIAASLALDRGEHEVAAGLIEALPSTSERYRLETRLAWVNGRTEEAKASEARYIESLSGIERLKAEIAIVTRGIEDRLPGPIDVAMLQAATRALDALDASQPRGEDRAVAMLALAHLRCSLAILGGRREAIEPLIETIESITGEDHISARFLRAQAALEFGAFEDANRLIQGFASEYPRHPRTRALQLSRFEHMIRNGDERVRAELTSMPPFVPLEHHPVATVQRLEAIRWTLIAEIDTGPDAVMAMRESLMHWRRAGCSGAAGAMTERIHLEF